jgi:hypothetical protein
MKSKILILILLFTAQIVKSQSFDKKSSWTIITTNMFDDTFSEISTYKVDSDTLIGGKSYSKLLRNNNFYSALRETEDNKIYAYFSDLERELLIYDFDWRPNKTLYCQTSYEDNVVQAILGNSIDSIQLLDGKYYKCVKNYAEEVSLIRGIGDTRGFFISTFDLPTNGNEYTLLCFHIDDILVYRNPNFSYCNTSSINIVTDNGIKIKVYPNPSNDILTIEFLENLKIDTFKIFDIKGSLIRTYEVKEKNKIEVKNLEKGIYMYSAIIKNNQNLSGKIIIK